MIIGTFNNWNIVAMPSSPAPKQIDFAINDSVGDTTSPFTRQSQVQAWPGADWWELNVSLPPMKRTQATQWLAFFMELRGKANVFSIGDRLGKTPQGNPQGTPVVDGSSASYNLATSTVLHTKGWTPNATGLLLPGDYLQIGYRLHVVVGASVAADANGYAQVNLWPSLREQPADGLTIITSNTTGLFRLAENKREWSVNNTKTYGLSFRCMEAR